MGSQVPIMSKVILTFFLLMSLPCGAWASERDWYELTIDGSRVGYGWIEQSQEPKHRLYTEVMRLEVTQLRKRASVENWYEVIRDEKGMPERINVESSIGDHKSGWHGSFSGEGRTLLIEITGTDRRQAFNVPPDITLPDRLTGALSILGRDGAQALEIHVVAPSAAQPVTLRATGLSAPGEPVTKVRAIESIGRGSREEIIWFDGEGRLLHREQPLYGARLVWDRCRHDCAAAVEMPYDLMSKLIVQSPYRIPVSAFLGSIRYVIARLDGKLPQMPVTTEQSAVSDGSTLIVTVCATCETNETLSVAERERYLRPNRWVQSDATEIEEFAHRHGQGGTPVEVMNRLVAAVRDHMDGGIVDYLGYSSALEALRTRSGDCTEYAVLLGALARAKKIPARIVFGLVYADRFSGKKDVFSPHAWVQAWTGSRWQSFDAGIGQFDATHLALRIGDGDPPQAEDGVMTPADLRIEKLGRVR